MNIIDTHGIFAARPDGGASLLPEGFDPNIISGFDAAPALATAAAQLSGQLDDAQSESDLDAALEHFRALWNSEIIDDETWVKAATEVIEEVCRWGEAVGDSAATN